MTLESLQWVEVGRVRPCTVCGGMRDCEMCHDENLMLCKYTVSDRHWGGGYVHPLFRPTTALDEWLKRQPIVIRFGCSIRIPTQNFMCRDVFDKDPQRFLTTWIEGALSNIWSGPTTTPPKVVVRYHPNVPLSPAASNLVATIAPQGLLNQGGGGT